jgi:hypothetical protein
MKVLKKCAQKHQHIHKMKKKMKNDQKNKKVKAREIKNHNVSKF